MIKKEVPKTRQPVLAKIKGARQPEPIAKAFGVSDVWFEVVYYDGTNWRPWNDLSNSFEKENQVVDWVYVEGCFRRNIPEEER